MKAVQLLICILVIHSSLERRFGAQKSKRRSSLRHVKRSGERKLMMVVKKDKSHPLT